MLRELTYPFDSELILRKKKSIKRKLLANLKGNNYISLRIAILGGSTTHEIKEILELFLLNYGFKVNFYESEYNQFWQESMFENIKLKEFSPDIIFIHTTTRNIKKYPDIKNSGDEVNELIDDIFMQYKSMWDKIVNVYHCPIIQNNFELPYYRLLGNRDVCDIHGRVHFINSLNEKFNTYASFHDDFFINDINYLSACYGLQKWADSFYWYMYKYALAVPAIPEFSFNLSNIIKAIYGKNKKAMVLDLDNTLWGGVVGEDGPENIEIGPETAIGQTFGEFQQYIKTHKDLGILLNIASKNDLRNVVDALNLPECILKLEDFLIIKANWEPKDKNIQDIARELNIGLDSLVFIDDNPAERHIVRMQLPDVSVPEVLKPECYINIIDRSGFFELTNLSEDDSKRNDMYKANAQRLKQLEAFGDYQQYLSSLEMVAEVKPFTSKYFSRIAQLTNKSNQFNLTTHRYNQIEIAGMAQDSHYITLYGKLKDKFGDNGLVAAVIGRKDKHDLHLELWIMSCRVLKRDLEFAMIDVLVELCQKEEITAIYGYYYPTNKNSMVRELFCVLGFQKVRECAQGNTVWKLDINDNYTNMNKVIEVIK